jgi:ribosome-associated translation inhibitor RaiA
MKLIIEGDRQLITDRVKQLAQTHLGIKINRYLEKFGQGIGVARLQITKGVRWGFKASLKMALPKKKIIFADSKNKNLLSTLTDVRNQAIKQIQSHKERLTNRQEIKPKKLI